MRIFVRHHVRHPLELCARRSVGIDQQRRFAKGYRAEIFHRAGGKVRNRDQIQFVAGIGNAVVSAEMFQRSLADIDGEGREMFLSRARHKHAEAHCQP